jgi:hypothetical protein
MSTNVIDVALPDLELDEIAAIENSRNRAIALNRYPGLDPRNATVTKMAAVLTEELIGEWGRVLHLRLAYLASLDHKSLERLQKKLRKAPVSPLNLWIAFPDEEPPVVHAALGTAAVVVEINEAATPELV